jgi:hypothetical protein
VALSSRARASWPGCCGRRARRPSSAAGAGRGARLRRGADAPRGVPAAARRARTRSRRWRSSSATTGRAPSGVPPRSALRALGRRAEARAAFREVSELAQRATRYQSAARRCGRCARTWRAWCSPRASRAAAPERQQPGGERGADRQHHAP